MNAYRRFSAIAIGIIIGAAIIGDRQLPSLAASFTSGDAASDGETTAVSQKNQSDSYNLYEYIKNLSKCGDKSSIGGGVTGNSDGDDIASTPEPSAIAGLVLAAGTGLWCARNRND